MLLQLSERVWTDTRALPKTPMKRVSTIARRADGTLVVHSANAGSEEEIAKLGEVSFVIVPSGYHRLDAPRFAARFPQAKILCPAGAADRVGKVVKVDGTYADFPGDAHVTLATLRGTAEREGVMTVRDADGATLVINDVLFNMPHVPGPAGLVLKYVTASSGGPKVSRIAQHFIAKDIAALAGHLRELAETPDLERIIVAHHVPIEDNPGQVLARVADTL